MYGRIHRSFFGSSVNETDVVTRLVFIGMIVLSDWSGKIDETRAALARRINVTLEQMNSALETLMEPDPSSRTGDYEGRRIIPIDPARSWGWFVVNKGQYRQGDVDPDEVRAAARDRKRKQREKERTNSDSSFTRDSSNKEEKNTTPSVTVTPGHEMSREKCDALFEKCWLLVPRKEGKLDARKYFNKDIRGLKDADDDDAAFVAYSQKLERAIVNYAALVANRDRDKIMHGSRLFRNFRDYVAIESSRRRDERPEGLEGVAL